MMKKVLSSSLFVAALVAVSAADAQAQSPIGERFHHSTSVGASFDIGYQRTADELGITSGTSSLRLFYRMPLDRNFGLKFIGKLRGDGFEDRVLFAPGGGAAIGVFIPTGWNQSLSLDLVATAHIGPTGKDIDPGLWTGVEGGLEIGWWWVPSMAHHDLGFGFILRGTLGADSLRGRTANVSGGVAFQF